MKDNKPTYEKLLKKVEFYENRKNKFLNLKSKNNFDKTKQYFENLINYANAPIIVWNTHFEIQLFNKAFERLTGYSADNVLGRTLHFLFSETSIAEILGKINITLNGNFMETIEIPILCKNGETRIVLWNSANIYDTDNKTLISTIAQGNDITERKIAEKELIKAQKKAEESDRLKSAFITNISHEVRTHMNSILGFTELLLEPYLTSKDELMFIEQIHESGQRMLETVTDIIEIS